MWGLKPNSRILLSNEDFIFKQTCQSEWNMQKFAKMYFWQTFCEKPVLTNFSQFFELHETNFYLDCEEHIFDRISKNTYPNQVGLVSSWSRSKNLSYELKLIFSSFWRNFIDCAWIRGYPAHVHQIRQFKQPWITSRCDTKFIWKIFTSRL